MSKPTKILMQTTIPTVEDDWSIARFSRLRAFLTGLQSQSGAALFEVTARDRGPLGIPDPVLANLNNLDFESLWLFGVDTGDGLTKEDCRGIPLFRKRGGGILATRDHMDLGCSLCSLGGIGDAHHFPSKNVDPDVSRRVVDGPYTTNILWPNFHSGANGDFQEIAIVEPAHPVLTDPHFWGCRIRLLPSHPHEGDGLWKGRYCQVTRGKSRLNNLIGCTSQGRPDGRLSSHLPGVSGCVIVITSVSTNPWRRERRAMDRNY